MSERHLINLSTAWMPPDPGSGRPAWIRRFGMPAGIGPGDRIWLVVQSPGGCGLTLAGETLPPVAAGERWRHDVTAKLAARNELQLAAAAGATATMPAVPIPVHGRCDLPADVGRVVLEIEPAGHASYHA
jgi:hypothetical protein